MDILINPPKKIPVTKEEFKNFTCYELACFWCNWKAAFYYNENGDLKMYTGRENITYLCSRNHRFKGIIWYEMSAVEMYFCIIPKDTKLYHFMKKHFSYLIME